MPHDKCNCSVCMRSQPLAEGPRSTASQPVCKWLLPCPRAWDHSLWQKDQEALRHSRCVNGFCHAHGTSVWSQNNTNTKQGEPKSCWHQKHLNQCRFEMHLHTLLPTLDQSSCSLLLQCRAIRHTPVLCPRSWLDTWASTKHTETSCIFFVTAMKAATNLFFLRSAMIPMLSNLYYMLACYNHLLHHTQKRTTILVTASNNSLHSAWSHFMICTITITETIPIPWPALTTSSHDASSPATNGQNFDLCHMSDRHQSTFGASGCLHKAASSSDHLADVYRHVNLAYNACFHLGLSTSDTRHRQWQAHEKQTAQVTNTTQLHLSKFCRYDSSDDTFPSRSNCRTHINILQQASSSHSASMCPHKLLTQTSLPQASSSHIVSMRPRQLLTVCHPMTWSYRRHADCSRGICLDRIIRR